MRQSTSLIRFLDPLSSLIPRPAEQSDIARWNGTMGAISEKTGLPMPGVKMGQDGGFQGYFRVDGRLDSKRLDQELSKGR